VLQLGWGPRIPKLRPSGNCGRYSRGGVYSAFVPRTHSRATFASGREFSGFKGAWRPRRSPAAPADRTYPEYRGPNVPQELQMIADARSHGMDVTTESYP